MLSQSAPSLFGELHALPIVVPRLVLAAEFHAERLRGSALGFGDVRLEFHSVRANIGDRIHKRMCQPEAAVVRQRDFADDETASGTKNWLTTQGKAQGSRGFRLETKAS